MADFLEVLGKFLESDFARENAIQIIGLQIGIIGIAVFITALYFNKIHVPVKLRRSDYIIPQYKEALKKIEELESENAKLKVENKRYKKYKDMESALDSDGLKEELDPGLKKFLKSSK